MKYHRVGWKNLKTGEIGKAKWSANLAAVQEAVRVGNEIFPWINHFVETKEAYRGCEG